MSHRIVVFLAVLFCLVFPRYGVAQTFATEDPVIKKMWEVGIENSQTEALGHVLIDRIGPRLAGSPNLAAAQDWLLEVYESWGVPARKEQYGTWDGWRQGILHVDMIAPRVATLEAELMGWSPGTEGPVEGPVVFPPEDLTRETVGAWLKTVRGAYVMTAPPEPTCRAAQELKQYARPETVERLDSVRTAIQNSWRKRLGPIGSWRTREAILDSAGVAGILNSRWSGGWGVNKIFDTVSRRAVSVDISCEDYSLLYRLAANGEAPVLRINAEATDLGAVPQFNVIAELKGTERPDEYVLLGAHLDSWHAGTGATDNGTGTLTMLEAMRILKETYPAPRRTIIVGHWGAEEVGLIGSRSFKEDHPEVVDGLQAAFNQDNGTWRIERIEGQGLLDAANHLPGWMQAVPKEISSHITLDFPGLQENGGSDHSSFLCAGAPSFRLQSSYDEYRQYTWHTNRDTYDKIVFDDLKENATLAAMLAYMASEDPEPFGREQAVLPGLRGQQTPRTWMRCGKAKRTPRRTE